MMYHDVYDPSLEVGIAARQAYKRLPSIVERYVVPFLSGKKTRLFGAGEARG